jgi:hypothetical protein
MPPIEEEYSERAKFAQKPEAVARYANLSPRLREPRGARSRCKLRLIVRKRTRFETTRQLLWTATDLEQRSPPGLARQNHLPYRKSLLTDSLR